MSADTDECSTGTHRCTSHQRCINNPGSYSCVADDAGTSTRPTTTPTTVAGVSNPTPLLLCPSGTIWNADRSRCESLLHVAVTAAVTEPSPVKRESVVTVTRCPQGGVWNAESRQCDVPLLITVPQATGGLPAICSIGSWFNTLTGRCEETATELVTSSPASQRPVRVKPASRCPIGYAWSRMSRRCEG